MQRAASYVIGVQPAQQYGTQQYGGQQYGTQPVSYPAQYNPYPAPAPPPVYDPYQAVPPQPTADMALAGTQQYAVYPVPLDQYTSADSSYASYAPAPAPSYGPPSHGGGYGGGGGGYGGGGYDNSPALSALALLSFLFLLNLIQQTLNNNNNTGTGGTGGTGTGTGGGRAGDGGGDWTQAWDAAQLELRVRGVLLDRVQWTQLAEETGSWLTRLRLRGQSGPSRMGGTFPLIALLVVAVIVQYVVSATDCLTTNCELDARKECQTLAKSVFCNMKFRQIKQIHITEASFPRGVQKIRISGAETITIGEDAIAKLTSLKFFEITNVSTLILQTRSLARGNNSEQITQRQPAARHASELHCAQSRPGFLPIRCRYCADPDQ
ncbi:hypothetical protein FJT64_020739 [Amphibalanus amphitrite]|uniref:Uncharacterized protein n=1 Tax=Amphibalanus amphitrite TaxID=1232801 RepID=A0A6A4WKS3_AMPAM|nr:hypothetical protein FJT64_020739 [Amphibalanus amphitrite]